MDRTSDIRKIKRYLKKNGLTLEDMGVEGTFKDMDDDTIGSVLDDMREDEAREAYDEYLQEESFNAMLDAQEELDEEAKEVKAKKTNKKHK